ncbi:SET domain-containing protein [Parathielavia appendiculata]|uniref:SET domain-containing protein n=1 Tax=Parathielavia appendiculata TaxID=2587402 RepID=A0AAN6TVX1_9PEZI|nr:SET domain-containing protein [Parathielavia appendiculata]
MNGHESPLDILPDWCVRHRVGVHAAIKAVDIAGRGNGWIISGKEALSNASDNTALLHIPREVILSAEYVVDYASGNDRFRRLLEGLPKFQSEPRLLILLFLLSQLVHHRLPEQVNESKEGQHEPWRQYISVQPSDVPVPTMWSDVEVSLLKGTSLEFTLAAKLVLLAKEFELITVRAQETGFWQEMLSEKRVSLRDWIWLDALFRSRSFELPLSGPSMVPCVDLANHSHENAAYFEQDIETGTVTMLLRNDKFSTMSVGDEVTISYGRDKPAAEMLFNYGFIDVSQPPFGGQRLVLSLDDISLWEDWARKDPFLTVKRELFSDAPMLCLDMDHAGAARWTCPFAYIVCVQQEDGFGFERMEDGHGTGRCTMSWQGKDISRMAGMLDLWLNTREELRNVIQGRVVAILLCVVTHQLKRLRYNGEVQVAVEEAEERGRASVLRSVKQLREVELAILERSLRAIVAEKEKLLQDGVDVKTIYWH